MINRIFNHPGFSLKKIPVSVLIVLVTLPFFLISADSWYHSDDFTSLLPFRASWSDIFGRLFTKDVFITAETTFYRPLALLLRALTTKLDSAYFGHLVNILLHYGSTYIFWKILLLLKLKPRYAAAGAIMFLVNPAVSDALFWISGLGDLMTTFFSLAVVLLILKYTENDSFDYKKIVVISLLYLASLLSKETSFILPLILLAIFAYKKELFKTSKVISILFVISISVFLIRGMILGHFLMGEADSVYFSYHFRYPVNFIKYLITSIIPARVHFLYINKLYLLSCLPVVVIWLIYLQQYKKKAGKEALFLFVLLLIAIIPVSGIFSVWRNYYHAAIIVFALVSAADKINKPSCKHLLNIQTVIYSIFIFYAGYSYYQCGNFNRKLVQAVAKIPEDEIILLNIPATFLDTPLIYEDLAFEDAVRYFHHQHKDIKIGLLRHSAETLPSDFKLVKTDSLNLSFSLSTPLNYEYFICNDLPEIGVSFPDRNQQKPRSASVRVQSGKNVYIFE